jgi:tetratricopeptide (TPR) repeat protein
MKQDSDARTTETDCTWLKNDDPEIYHLLLAVNGDLDALRWLKHHGDGLFLLVEALSGAKEAVDTLQAQPADKLIDLFDTIAHCDVEEWLSENQPELHGLFAFVRGEEDAWKGVKSKRAVWKRVAEIVRAKYRNYRDEDADGAAVAEEDEALPEGAAADVGCLIGEMHLHNQEYHKAIEAFSRAIANDPTPDAHVNRARAYRALAALDDRAAAELRTRSVR